VLRDDGMSYGDYVEQLTYLLFQKMADERSKPPFNMSGESPSPILKGHDWPSLLAKDGDELFDHYRHTLEKLGAEKGTIGLIFGKAQNKFQDPAKLRRLVVDLIDCENWSAMGADVKGDAYEGLLEKNAQDTKNGAGQYFTPRPLIQAMVDCIAPKPGDGLTGEIVEYGHWFKDKVTKIITRETLVDLAAEVAGSLIPGGGVAIKLIGKISEAKA
jgi:type I restriction enzyme M protein